MQFRTTIAGLVAAVSLAACSNGPGDPYGGGTGAQDGGGAGGGPVGSVTIGQGIQFVSAHNGTQNPAVDTIPVGGTVTWTWTGPLQHGVQSTGATSFTSSGIKSGGATYAAVFTTAGTYQYDCAVHGTAMRGTIVVQ